MAANADENLDRASTSAKHTAEALDDLTAAARKADEVFSTGILSIPRSVGDAISSINAPLGEAFQFFERRFRVLQGLTDYGVNFNYSMQGMENSANNARMTLSDLAGVVKENSERLSMFGGNLTEGTEAFLRQIQIAQTDQVKYGNTLEENARRLGYSVTGLRDTISAYEEMVSLSRSRDRFDAHARNQSAQNFIENIDALAQLTGKQRDKLADEAANIARQGQVIIRARQLGDRGDEYQTFLTGMTARFGESFGRLAVDMLGPGFGQTDETRLMQSQFYDVSTALERLRMAYEDPNVSDAEIARLEQQVHSYSAAVHNLKIMDLGIFHSTTEVGRTMADIAGQQARSAAMFDRVQQELRSSGQASDSNAVEAEIQRRIRTGQLNAQQTQGPTGDQNIRNYQEMINQQIRLDEMARDARQRVIDIAYNNFSTVVTRVGNSLTEFGTRLVEAAIQYSRDLESKIQGMFENTQRGQDSAAAYDRALALNTAEGIRLAQQLIDTESQLAQTTDPAEQERLRARSEELQRSIEQLRGQQLAIDARNAEININGADTSRINRVPGSQPTTGQEGPANIGTLGRTGSFFADFGSGTNVQLHGIEGVFRPNHIEDIMSRSSRGTIGELVKQITSSGFGNDESISTLVSSVRNVTSSIDGRLNTIRANISRDMRQTQTFNPEMIADQIGLALGRMPDDMRRAFEDALGSTIKQPMEQLVSVSTRGAEYQERVYKNTRGISQDYLRGA